jgi:hypothetical protein
VAVVAVEDHLKNQEVVEDPVEEEQNQRSQGVEGVAEVQRHRNRLL